MSFLRLWKDLDLADIKKHLLVIGELSAECFSCHNLGIKPGSRTCPGCGTVFKYIAFRRKIRSQDFKSLKEERAGVRIIDFSDFKRASGEENAHNLFK